jgi:hypothetical protein
MLQDGVMDSKRHGYMKPDENGYIYIYTGCTGWWLTYPSDKYESNGSIIPFVKWKKMIETTNKHIWI